MVSLPSGARGVHCGNYNDNPGACDCPLIVLSSLFDATVTVQGPEQLPVLLFRFLNTATLENIHKPAINPILVFEAP